MLTRTEIRDCIESWKRTRVLKGGMIPNIYHESYPDELVIIMRYRNKGSKRILNDPEYFTLKYALDTMWKEISCTCNYYGNHCEKTTIDYSFNNHARYVKYNIEDVCAAFDNWCQSNLIKDVIFNDPATIVFWSDGTKTVVQARDDDAFDPEKGLAMAIVKKSFGNKGNYYNQVKKWLPKEDEK